MLSAQVTTDGLLGALTRVAPDYLGREVARLNFAAPMEGKVLPLHGRAG